MPHIAANGELDRAERLALDAESPAAQRAPLYSVIRALVAAGQLGRARRHVDTVAALAQPVDIHGERWSFSDHAALLAIVGESDAAQAVARSIPDENARFFTIADLAE